MATIVLYIVGIIFIVILFYVAILLSRLFQANQYEKRIDKYTINSLNSEEISYVDKLYNSFFKIRKRFSNRLNKISIFKKYSNRYEKYIDRSKVIPEEPMDYISNKFFVSFLLIVIVLASDLLKSSSIDTFSLIIQLLLACLIGFFIPDLFLLGRKQYLKKKVESDILKAVIIMNNAFKSGRSTMQAIKIVSEELEGATADEFKKMYIDLTFGLSVENTFKRFSERVNIEEVRYITTSLTILNKTGGNIVKVFSSIEKNFFNRKRIDDELKSLTSSSNAMFWILISIPIFIVMLITLMDIITNKGFSFSIWFFNPLFKSMLGFILLSIIIIMYILYVRIVRKVMKIR